MSARIFDKKVNLDYAGISDFFEKRGDGKDLKSKYSYVLFQDDHPELAEQRDRQEKEKITPMLDWKNDMRVLDIGCGIGRWGEVILEKGAYYVGMDGSRKLIGIAEKNLESFDNKKLAAGFFQNVLSVLEKMDETKAYDAVFVNGVFMYLNDGDFVRALTDVISLCKERCQLYLKESLGVERRLTLDRIYSESLTQEYSALYRSIDEFRKSISEAFVPEGFAVISEGQLFDDELVNRKETVDYYMILKR